MDKKEYNIKRSGKEKNRLKRILRDAGVSEQKKKLLEPVVDNVAWMKIQLDDARDAIRDGELVVEYDNGGGQKGIRENPYFKGYENLWRSYMAGMGKILDAIPGEVVVPEKAQPEKPKTVLELVRNKYEAGS